MNRHQIIGIVTGVCGVILAITARSQAIITLIIFTLVALSIFFKDKHPLLSRRLLPPWALYCLCVFTLVSAIFVSFHTHVKHAPRPFLGKNTQGVDPKTQDPQNTLPDAQNDISLTRTPVRKKILEIMASEDFTKQIKESVDKRHRTKTSFLIFKLPKISGITGGFWFEKLWSLVLLPEHLSKHFPGKVPSELDVEMKQQLLRLIEEWGYEKGTKTFLKDSKNALWLAARFNILQDDGNSIGNWQEQMLAETFGSVAEVSARQIPSIAPDFHPDPPPSDADSVPDAGIPPSSRPALLKWLHGKTRNTLLPFMIFIARKTQNSLKNSFRKSPISLALKHLKHG